MPKSISKLSLALAVILNVATAPAFAQGAAGGGATITGMLEVIVKDDFARGFKAAQRVAGKT